jgi:hypothetical protein
LPFFNSAMCQWKLCRDICMRRSTFVRLHHLIITWLKKKKCFFHQLNFPKKCFSFVTYWLKRFDRTIGCYDLMPKSKMSKKRLKCRIQSAPGRC